MANQNNSKVDEILSQGVLLQAVGINNWGFTKEQALNAVKDLKQHSIAVLGGDVLKKESGQWIHTYDNWYCNRLSHESNEQFVTRSWQVATEYIEHYPNQFEVDNLFVIVAG